MHCKRLVLYHGSFVFFIPAMFVDISDNHSVTDIVRLSYIYEEVDELEVKSLILTFDPAWYIAHVTLEWY